jgi:hypothetical protein
VRAFNLVGFCGHSSRLFLVLIAPWAQLAGGLWLVHARKLVRLLWVLIAPWAQFAGGLLV